jgi:hypothetical protein
MGWRDRDYAVMSDAERRRFYGVGGARRRRSSITTSWFVVVLAVAIVGMFVLPHFTIAGRHWHLFAL